MIPVIIVSVFVLVFFILFVVYLLKVIFKVVNKQKVEKSTFAKLIVSGVVWAILGCVNLVLVFSVLSKGDPLLDKIIKSGADIASKSIVYTFEAIEKNWDKDTLSKADKIGFEVVGFDGKTEDPKIKYTIKLLLNNKLDKGQPISYWDLTSQNLLFILDSNDVFYSLKVEDQSSEIIPVGKSYLTVSLSVSKDIKLKYIGIGENKTEMKSMK